MLSLCSRKHNAAKLENTHCLNPHCQTTFNTSPLNPFCNFPFTQRPSLLFGSPASSRWTGSLWAPIAVESLPPTHRPGWRELGFRVGRTPRSWAAFSGWPQAQVSERQKNSQVPDMGVSSSTLMGVGGASEGEQAVAETLWKEEKTDWQARCLCHWAHTHAQNSLALLPAWALVRAIWSWSWQICHLGKSLFPLKILKNVLFFPWLF